MSGDPYIKGYNNKGCQGVQRKYLPTLKTDRTLLGITVPVSTFSRDAIIKAAKVYGGSIRQLSRLTGLSYGLIRKVS